LVRALKTLRRKVEKGEKGRVLSPAEMPQNWLRRLAEIVLYHLLVNGHYHRQSLVDRHGASQVEADAAALESEVWVQVRKLLGAIDGSEEG
jgi:hypothetical protein